MNLDVEMIGSSGWELHLLGVLILFYIVYNMYVTLSLGFFQ